jgi:hypothetical protein
MSNPLPRHGPGDLRKSRSHAGGNAVMHLFSECDRLGEACFVNPVDHINAILWRAD